MNRFTISAILLSATLLLTAAVPAAATSGQQFLGRWHGIDVGDESNVGLWIIADGWSGGRLFDVRGSDDKTGDWCGGHARMQALAVPDGENENILTTTGTWWCLDPQESVWPFGAGTLTYDPDADTITDGENTYYRGG